MEPVVKTLGRNEFGYITGKTTARRKLDGGIASLMLIKSVEKPLVISNPVEKIKILDEGYSWLQIAYDNEYHWLSAFYDEKGCLISVYLDMTDGNIIDGENSCFTDMFLDYEIYKGRIYEIDLDDLLNAYEKGITSSSQYQRTIDKGRELLQQLKHDHLALIELCNNIRQELLESINEKHS